MSFINEYIKTISSTLATGDATEHSHRPSLKRFLDSQFNEIESLNEPKRHKVGAPDFIILNNNVPVGYLETKDVGTSLNEAEKSEQLSRYLDGFENFVLTNYLEFRWYIKGELRLTANIATLRSDNTIRINKSNTNDLLQLLKSFINYEAKIINNAKELALRMATMSKICYQVISTSLKDEIKKKSNLYQQYEIIKDNLIQDITVEQFADMLSQTIAYGLFTARINENKPEKFNRMTAAYDIPKTNPFLRDFFGQIVGPSIDDNLVWIVEDFVSLLRRTDINLIIQEFKDDFGKEDPILHFYETYLEYYKPDERAQRGVYYTPEPVVEYIVKSVDIILKTRFKMKDGLADTGKTKQNYHKVQILDPSTGTGTFLASVIDHIYNTFKNSKGLWSGYVGNHLLPRINGFELLMAPYTISHMKLGMKLAQTGFTFDYDTETHRRIKVFLTNTLDKPSDTSEYSLLSLLSNFLSGEAEGADNIKTDNPIMVVLGNPPYNSESVNDIEWINKLMRGKDIVNNCDSENYFTVEGKPLGERNTKWLNDDYVKFIRFSQWKIDQTGYGVLAFITPHGFLDNPTFRGMRESLMNTFDDLYILDTHGNANKQEGKYREDENVFDIATGTAISFFIKRSEERKTVKVFHYDLWGKRKDKYKWLYKNDIESTEWEKINPTAPFYYFVPQDLTHQKEYELGYKITDAMPLYSNGIVTARDQLTIQKSREELSETIYDFANLEEEEARTKYNLGKDVRDWKIHLAQQDLLSTHIDSKNITSIYYRPFDWRYTYYTGKTKGFLCMPRKRVMDNFINNDNLAILTTRMTKLESFKHLLVTDMISEAIALSGSTSVNAFSFPLYAYKNGEQNINFSQEFLDYVEKKTKLKFKAFANGSKNKTFSEYDLFYYIISILSSPTYCSRYNEYLKRDYPKIPITTNIKLFFALKKLGKEISTLHLFQKDLDIKTNYPVEGDNIVRNIKYKQSENKLYINDNQYFDNVPEVLWNFEIGGYKVVDKWLGYRMNEKLSYEELTHIQKILATNEELIDKHNKIDETIQKHNKGFPID